jgi:uncharacterized protein YuzE
MANITYDDGADIAYIQLVPETRPGQVADTVCLSDAEGAPDERLWGINLDFDESDKLIGIEVEGASRALPPDVLARAPPPDR